MFHKIRFTGQRDVESTLRRQPFPHMGHITSRRRPDLSGGERFDADGFAFQGQKFNLVSLAFAMHMHHHADIAHLQSGPGQRFQQYH